MSLFLVMVMGWFSSKASHHSPEQVRSVAVRIVAPMLPPNSLVPVAPVTMPEPKPLPDEQSSQSPQRGLASVAAEVPRVESAEPVEPETVPVSSINKTLDLRLHTSSDSADSLISRQTFSDLGGRASADNATEQLLTEFARVTPDKQEPYINTFGDVERRISEDCVLQQHVRRLAAGNDEMVVFLTFCKPSRDREMKAFFKDLAERQQRGRR